MLEQPLPMSSALLASARSLGFLMGYIGLCQMFEKQMSLVIELLCLSYALINVRLLFFMG